MSDRICLTSPFLRPWMKESGAAAPRSKMSVVKGIIAGGITGGIEICITFPTEYVKTQLQLDEKGTAKRYTGIVDCVKKTVSSHGFFGLYRGLSASYVCINGVITYPTEYVKIQLQLDQKGGEKLFTGSVNCIRKTVSKHGFSGLYRGLTVLLYCAYPKHIVQFGSFELLKNQCANKDGYLTPYQRVFCGLGAGVGEAIFAVTPMETVKVKFINDQRSANPRFKGFYHGVRIILKEQGFRGVYQGLTATVLKQGTNQACRFYVLETLKDVYRQGEHYMLVPTVFVGIFGVIAGAASVFCNTPIDVVKTRMQGLEAHKYKNTWDCFVKIWKHEGPAAFYKGTVPRLSRVCLDVALTFMIYEKFMEIFNNAWP